MIVPVEGLLVCECRIAERAHQIHARANRKRVGCCGKESCISLIRRHNATTGGAIVLTFLTWLELLNVEFMSVAQDIRSVDP